MSHIKQENQTIPSSKKRIFPSLYGPIEKTKSGELARKVYYSVGQELIDSQGKKKYVWPDGSFRLAPYIVGETGV